MALYRGKMRSIEYSHGFMGYVLRYLGAPVLILLSGVFIFIDYLILINWGSMDSLVDVAVLPAISLFMIPLLWAGAWMCLSHGRAFTCSYEITPNELKVFEKGKEVSTINVSLAEIRYRWLFKAFLVSHEGLEGGSVVLMNNAQRESGAFSEIKDMLLPLDNTRKVLW